MPVFFQKTLGVRKEGGKGIRREAQSSSRHPKLIQIDGTTQKAERGINYLVSGWVHLKVNFLLS